MNVRKFFVKLLVILLIILTLVNYIWPTYSFADDEPPTPPDTSSEESVNNLLSGLIDNSSAITGSIVNFFKVIILAPFRAARSLNYGLASSGGTQKDGDKVAGDITPFDIFFNRFTLLDVNVFSMQNRDGANIEEDSLVAKIRTSIASWYYALRALAISLAGIMFLWNIARAMSKNTSADQKVVAKNAIIDWILSFALIFFMHYIIILVITFNDMFCDFLENVATNMVDTVNASNFLDTLEGAVFSNNFILGVAALIVYALVNFQTLLYILIYVQRFLTVIFLIMISPLVPITYSMDKMRGGSGVTLNTWFKELVYNVFVQSLHALVYSTVVGVAMQGFVVESVTSISDLGNAVVAVVAMLFVRKAEKLGKTIFGFNNSQIINNSVFSNSATSIANVAGAVGSTARRVATGGPLISFGKNVDGSHIGIGQVVQGLGENAGRAIGNIPNTLKQTGSAFVTGLRSK